MQTKFGHIEFFVDAANLPFYKDLLTFLGWSILYQGEKEVGGGAADGSSLWFIGKAKKVSNDYDGPGMNHLAFRTTTQAEVDETVAYLRQHGGAAWFDTPRHRPEFCADASQTYYQVMFESPDRILFEVVYKGAKE